jgi:hypothetical protein
LRAAGLDDERGAGVCNEGWELVNASFVFHELGSESRDKFLATGQNIAVKGTVIGYYVLRRCEDNRRAVPSADEFAGAASGLSTDAVQGEQSSMMSSAPLENQPPPT